MPNPIVNIPSPAITIAVLEDDAGNPITGATWSDGGSLDPGNPRSAWPDDPSDFIEGSGNIYWLVGYEFPTAGEWLLVPVANGDPLLTSPIAITVTDPATDAQTIASAVLAASVTGGAANTVAAKLNEIGTTTVDATVPIEANPSTIPIVRGSTYSNTIGNAIDFTSDDWPNLTGASVTMEIATITGTSYSLPMTVITPTGQAEVRLELSSATTAAFPVFVGQYEIVATLTGPATASLATGTFYAKD